MSENRHRGKAANAHESRQSGDLSGQ
jgi:hypothetical protein